MKTTQNIPPRAGVGIRNISDYSPFGVLLMERTVETANFRRGFQGQETDDEVKGDGNSVNFKYRMHDPRVGRFFVIDPLSTQYPHLSVFSFSENRVINSKELEGLESTVAILFDSDVNYRGGMLERLTDTEVTQRIIKNSSPTSFKDAFVAGSKADEFGEIGFVAIWGHGIPNMLFGYDDGSLITKELQTLEKSIEQGEIKFSENSMIYIGNCNAGTLDKNQNFAQRLADITGAKVVAGSTDNPWDDRGHRGSVGVKNESNGNMVYTMWWPKLDNFRLFEKGKLPVELGSFVDIKLLHERTTTTPVNSLPTRQLTTIPTRSDGNRYRMLSSDELINFAIDLIEESKTE